MKRAGLIQCIMLLQPDLIASTVPQSSKMSLDPRWALALVSRSVTRVRKDSKAAVRGGTVGHADR